MARPAYERVGTAFKSAYQRAGLKQDEIAAELGVDQATVSRWARGLQRIDLDYFPRIDKLCSQPTGYVLGLAGYVANAHECTMESAVKASPHLNKDERRVILGIDQLARKREAISAR
jgi:transcriptional regulator with XRE-family HTH domain